jgi:hypothetical protein
VSILHRVRPIVQPARRRSLAAFALLALAAPVPILPFAVGVPPRPRAPKGGVEVAGRFYRGGSYLPASPVATDAVPLVVDRRCPACNDLVIEGASVVIAHGLAAERKLHACPRCQTAIVLSPKVTTLGTHYFTRQSAPARDAGPAWTWDAWTDADTWELGPDREPEDTTDHAVAFAPTRREEMYKLGYELGLDRDDAAPFDAADASDLDAFGAGWRDGKAEWDRRLDEMCDSAEYAEFSARVSDFDIYAPGATS